jgi:hypothetical protein
VAQEVELAFRNLADSCLLFVDRQLAMRLSSLSTQFAGRTMSIWPVLTHSPTTFVHNLGSRLRCVKCAKVGIHLG